MLFEKLSLEALYYDLISETNGGRPNKDLTISPDLIKSWIVEKRWKYIDQARSKNKKLDTVFVQSFCAEMTPVNSSECCDVDLPCTFLRSTLPMPQFIQLNRVGNVEVVGKNYQVIPYERVALEKYAPHWALKKPKFYIKDTDNFLYAYIHKDINPESLYLTKVGISGILVDPRAVSPFNCLMGNCYSDTDLFPLSVKMWEAMRSDLLMNELRIAMITDMDDHNNSKGDAEVNNLRKLNVQKAQD